MIRRGARASLAQRLAVEAHAVWLAARDPRAPRLARIVGVAVAAYALSPLDLIPEWIPVLGLLDDMVLVPFGLWLFLKLLPRPLYEEHLATAQAAAQRPSSVIAAILIIIVWVAVVALVWYWLRGAKMLG